MEILVVRRKKTDLSAIGDLYIDGVKKYVTLEDTDRGLTNQMSLEQIAKIKVKGKTAIPTGRYKVYKYNSPTRGWCLQLEGVPGFSYIQIHVGNYHQDTDGCLLVGMSVASQPNAINNSRVAIDALNKAVFPLLDAGKEVWYTVV